jgi:hypothetical protein
MEYGEITNVRTDMQEEYRIGDYGKDQDGNYFFYGKDGWRPTNPNKYEAYYWKKKYEETNQMLITLSRKISKIIS